MKKIAHILFFCFLFHCSFGEGLQTQEHSYRFNHWNTEQGLSQNTIVSIAQDSAGYLWFATSNGINRFDGESFRQYTSAHVLSLNVDLAGRVWASTSNGVLLYDKKDDIFRDVLVQLHPDWIINHVQNIIHDIHNKAWICETSGVFRIDVEDSSLKRIDVPEQYLAIFNYGRDFVSTGGDSLFFSAGESVFSINTTTCQVSELFVLPEVASTEYIMRIVIDGQGRIWAGTFLGRLFCYTPEAKKLTEIVVPKTNLVNDMVLESDSTIIVSFDYAGLYRYNTKTGQAIYLYDRTNERNEIGTNKIVSVYIDRQNILWLGHYQAGVSAGYLAHSGFHTINTLHAGARKLDFPIVSAILKDEKGNLWVGTDGGGIEKFAPNATVPQIYSKDVHDPHSLPDNAVLCMLQDGTGQIWIGSYRGGLARYLPEIDGFVSYTHDDLDPESISIDDVRSIHECSDGYLWLATHSKGFSRFDRTTGLFRNYFQKETDSVYVLNNWTYAVEQDYRGNIWIGTSRGVMYYMPEADSIVNPSLDAEIKPEIVDVSCNTIFSDSKNRLWFGTEYGLFQYDFDKNTFPRKGTSNGLGRLTICSIVEDKSGLLWISTGNGIYRFDPETASEEVYTAREGLQGSQFVSNSVFQDENGFIYFGGTDGITYFKPENLSVNDAVPTIEITGIEVMGKKLTARELHKKSVTLAHNRNFISFKFIGLNFVNFEKNRYKYILEGLEPDWNNAGAERKAVYTSLPPGSYVFRVIGANNDGVWNTKGDSFSVTILPPWWATMWFRAFVAILAILVFLLIYFAKVHKINAQKKLLEKEVVKRTHDLQTANLFLEEKSAIIGTQNIELVEKNSQIQEQNKLLIENQEEIESQRQNLLSQREEILAINEELQKKNDQLAQHDKVLTDKNDQLQELINTKDKMLSIIAHDLKNPMNTLIGFSSLLIGKAAKYPSEKIERFAELINRASVNSYRLLENLLTWARSQTGSIHMEPESHDLLAIVEENIDMLNDSASKKNVELKCKYLYSKDEMVAFVDKNTTSTIIRNVISNAIKFTPSGGEVSVSVVRADNNMVRVSVCDNGVGMTEDQQQKLFKIERNNSTMGTDNEHGTGLGLVICKEFAEMNNGYIEVYSVKDQGTSFDLYLPVS